MLLAARILIVILSLILVFIGLYLWDHRQKPFMLFHPEKHKGLSITLTIMSILLIICGIATLAVSFLKTLMPLIIMIVINVVLVSLLSFILLGFIFY